MINKDQAYFGTFAYIDGKSVVVFVPVLQVEVPAVVIPLWDVN